jgi:hypothetical protein
MVNILDRLVHLPIWVKPFILINSDRIANGEDHDLSIFLPLMSNPSQGGRHV